MTAALSVLFYLYVSIKLNTVAIQLFPFIKIPEFLINKLLHLKPLLGLARMVWCSLSIFQNLQCPVSIC